MSAAEKLDEQVCRRCQEIKPIAAFARDKPRPGHEGPTKICRDCRNTDYAIKNAQRRTAVVKEAVKIARPLPVVNDNDLIRPRRRSECVNGVRPCPWASCKFNLLVDVVRPSRSTPQVRENIEIEDGNTETCALDIADRGIENDREQVAKLMGLSVGNVRQIENKALAKMKRKRRYVD